MSLRGRFALVLAGVAVGSVLVTAFVAYGLVSRFAADEAIRQLRRDATVLARVGFDGEDAMQLRGPAQLRVATQLLRAAGDVFARVGPGGRVLAEDPAAAELVAAVGAERLLAGRVEGTVEAGGRRYAYVGVPVLGGQRAAGAILLARPSSLAAGLFRPVAARVAAAGLSAVLVALAVSALIAGTLSARVRRLADAAGSIAAGDLTHRVAVEGRDEIASLASGFNAMASSLAEARRREHEFLGSVSHELRTPVTAIRGYAGALADGTAATASERDNAVAVIDAESARLERLVQDVVDLARLGARELRVEPASVDVAATLAEAARAHAAAAAEAGVALELAAAGRLETTSDALRVRQIVSNLVENALRVTPAGGRVLISGATVSSAAGGAVIVVDVADTGPGIAVSDVPHVFERSYLWNVSRGERPVGNGLGLAIVRELASLLGGRVSVVSAPGRGSTFRLELPVR